MRKDEARPGEERQRQETGPKKGSVARCPGRRWRPLAASMLEASGLGDDVNGPAAHSRGVKMSLRRALGKRMS